MSFGNLKPFPWLRTNTGKGNGLAVCPSLNLLVTSDIVNDTLSVWRLPTSSSDGGLRLACTLGGVQSKAPMKFMFYHGTHPYNDVSGYLAFTTSSSLVRPPLLLVTDAGHNAVHVVDVMHRTHVGYVASPGSITGPRGVAASTSTTLPLVAVSASVRGGDHVVILYRRTSDIAWEEVRVIGERFGFHDGQFNRPFGLRFNRDGSGICVADSENDRVSVFRVDNGDFVRHITTHQACPRDVEEVEGGWLITCFDTDTVVCVRDGPDGEDEDGAQPSLDLVRGGFGYQDGKFFLPATLATVPGLGLVVREFFNERIQVFATPDTIAMYTNMSGIRIAWMSAVARGFQSPHAHARARVRFHV
jgi:hypothetical protein